MPLIPYPNVPPLPGVPPLSRTGAQYVGAALAVVAQFLPTDLFGQQWAIIDNETETVVLVPDSFVDFEFKQDQKIPIYPLQAGAFASYNKVSLPYEIRVTVTCSGNGPMQKDNFINTLNQLLTSLTLLDIQTPGKTYTSVNLVHVDYRREARNGATLIIAKLWFQWVRIVTSSAPTAQPDGESPTSNGQVSPQEPTAQNAANGVSSTSAGNIQ